MSEEEISTVLNTYMYLDYREADDGMNVEEIVKELSGQKDCAPGGIHYGEYLVLSQAAKNPEIGSLVIGRQSHLMGFDNGTTACTFQTPDKSRVYVVYRGTADGEWPDNGIGMTQSSTVQQQRALSYFETTVEQMKLSEEQRLIITGHSKGGNKAQYVLMTSKYANLADVCYNIDGQGFSEHAIREWKSCYGEEEYEKRRSKIFGIYGENDYVNVLGHSIVPEENICYIKTPVEKSNFAGYHDIKYLFAKQILNPVTGEYQTVFTGKRNAYALQRGDLGNYGARLSGEVMKLPAYRRDGCASVIMHLMEVTRGSKKGINNEKLSLLDLDDFQLKGTEVIMGSLFCTKEGAQLLHGFLKKTALTQGMKGDVYFGIEEERLKQQMENLSKLGGRLKKEGEALAAVEEKLSHAMRGEAATKQKLLFCEREIKKLILVVEKLTEQLEEIISLYREADNTVFNFRQMC